MKTIFDHIETVKAKPHHVREKVAFAVAGGGTAFVALLWVIFSFGSGTFAIQNTSFAQSTGAEGTSGVATVGKQDANTNYGVAGAAAAVPSSTSAPAHIEIVDSPSTTVTAPADPTVIPF